MIIFPLSISAKIVLILIACFLAMIWSMMTYPQFWKRRFRKSNQQSKFLKVLTTFSDAKERKKFRKEQKRNE